MRQIGVRDDVVGVRRIGTRCVYGVGDGCVKGERRDLLGKEGAGYTDFRSESGGFFNGAKELRSLFPLGVLDFLVVEETDRRAAPYEPVSVMLDSYLSVSLSIRTTSFPSLALGGRSRRRWERIPLVS